MCVLIFSATFLKHLSIEDVFSKIIPRIYMDNYMECIIFVRFLPKLNLVKRSW